MRPVYMPALKPTHIYIYTVITQREPSIAPKCCEVTVHSIRAEVGSIDLSRRLTFSGCAVTRPSAVSDVHVGVAVGLGLHVDPPALVGLHFWWRFLLASPLRLRKLQCLVYLLLLLADRAPLALLLDPFGFLRVEQSLMPLQDINNAIAAISEGK